MNPKELPIDDGVCEGRPVLLLKLSEYEIVNLAEALRTCYGTEPLAATSPLQAIHTGDWTLALCYRLQNEIKKYDYKTRPNKTALEMRQHAEKLR